MIYARHDAGLLPVHVPASFVVLKLLGFWFQPTPLGLWSGRNCGAGWHVACACCLLAGSPIASWSTKSVLELPGLFGHLIKHVSPCSSALLFTRGTCSAQSGASPGFTSGRLGTGQVMDGWDRPYAEALLAIRKMLKQQLPLGRQRVTFTMSPGVGMKS